MSPNEPRVEQVRRMIASQSAPSGRRRAESAVAARWLRALRSRPQAAPPGSELLDRPAS